MNKQVQTRRLTKEQQAQKDFGAALLKAQGLIRNMGLNDQGEAVQKISRETRGDVSFETVTWLSEDIRVTLVLSRWVNARWWKLEAYDARDPEGSGAAVELATGSDVEDWAVAREYLQDAFDRLSA